MKASVKLRTEEDKPPLFRAKLPIAAQLGLPLISSAATSDIPDDLSFHLRTDLPAGPSLKLSFAPRRRVSPFSLSLRSGLGFWGSPRESPILFSFHLPLPFPASSASAVGAGASPSFLVVLKPKIGDFSFRKTVSPASSLNHDQIPSCRNPLGGGTHHPLSAAGPASLEDLFSTSGVQVAATTIVPVTRRSAVKLQCGVNIPGPPSPASSLWRWRLPYLTVKKISFEAVGDAKVELKDVRLNEQDMEAMKDLGFWMRREMEELQREDRTIRENIEEVWTRVLDRRDWRPQNDGW